MGPAALQATTGDPPVSGSACRGLRVSRGRAGAAQGKRGAAEDGGLGTCSVCLDEFGDGVVVRTLPCLHHFHPQCVDPWLRQQGRSAPCPVCKTPVFQG